MVKIDTNSSIQKTALRRILKQSKSDSTGFSVAMSNTSDAEAPVPAQAIQSNTHLLSLQEINEKQLAKERGEKILNLLSQFRNDLLNSNFDPEQLLNLKQYLKSYSSSISDPKLAEVLAEIEQRANIELAKRDLI